MMARESRLLWPLSCDLVSHACLLDLHLLRTHCCAKMSGWQWIELSPPDYLRGHAILFSLIHDTLHGSNAQPVQLRLHPLVRWWRWRASIL